MVKLFLRNVLLFFLLLFIFPSQASAHQIGGNGFMSGITHPLLGLDHLLAMVAVGIISTQLGKKTNWTILATFMISMILGGIIAILGFGLPLVETGIALSILVFGIFIAFPHQISMIGAVTCVAIFAFFHGHAHGSEMSFIMNPFLYVFGFIISTAFLLRIGAFLGLYAKKKVPNIMTLRYSGLGISLMGVYFLVRFLAYFTF